MVKQMITITYTTPCIDFDGIPAKGGEYTLGVLSDTQWKARTNTPDCYISSEDKGSLRVMVGENNSHHGRQIAVQVFTADGFSLSEWSRWQEGKVQ